MQQPSQGAVDQACVNASVKVQLSRAAGSGTVVYVDVQAGRALVITCKHVVQGSTSGARVTFPSGKTAAGEVFDTDPTGSDLAAITIPGDASTPYVSIAQSGPTSGATIWSAGYPHMVGPNPRAGVIESGFNSPGHFYLSIRVDSGDSGSGAFNTAKELIGVIHSKRSSNGPGGAVAVDHVCLSRFFQRAKNLFAQRHRNGPGPVPPQPGPDTPPAPMPDWAKRLKDLEDRHGLLDQKQDAHGKLLDRIRDDLAKANANFRIVEGALQDIHALGTAANGSAAGAATLARGADARAGAASALAQAAHDKLPGLAKLIEDIDAKGDGHAGAIAAVAGKLPAIEKLASESGLPALAKVHEVESRLSPVIGKLADVDSRFGWLMPIALSALGLGGVYPLVKGGQGVLHLFAGRRQSPKPTTQPFVQPSQAAPNDIGRLADVLLGLAGRHQPQPPTTVPSPVTHPVQFAMQPPPVPNEPTHEVKFVGVPTGSGELANFLKAMEVAGRDYPGSIQTINLIQSLKKQLDSPPAK